MKSLISIGLLSATIAIAACSEQASDQATVPATEPSTVTASANADTAAGEEGAMLYPDLPGASQSCLGVEGPIEVGAQVVLHNCTLPKDYLFAADAGGKLAIAGHPDLCLDLEGPGMGKEPVVILNTCNSEPMSWMTTATAVDSAPVSSDAADCLKVVEGEQFPFAIGITPCPENAEVTAFFLEKP